MRRPAHALQPGGEERVRRAADPEALFFGERQYLPRLVHARRERLFAEQMLAGTDDLPVRFDVYVWEDAFEDAFKEVRIYSSLLELFAHIGCLCTQFGSFDVDAGTNTERANMKLMAQACMYISENCVKPLTLNDVALQVGVSKSHFSHLFKSYTNMTFVDFLTTERIKLAESFFPNPQLQSSTLPLNPAFPAFRPLTVRFGRSRPARPRSFERP